MSKNQITIFPATSENQAEWDKFVKKNDGSVYQLYSWAKICQKSYGYLPVNLIAKEAGRVVGIFPGVLKGPSKTFISLPFVDYACWLTPDPNVAIKFQNDILHRFRNFEIFSPQNLESPQTRPAFEVYSLLLSGDYQSLFKHYHKKTRNMVRKAWGKELTSAVEKPSGNLVAEFSRLYQETMKHLGTISLSEKFIQNIAEDLYEFSFLSVASYQEKPVAFLWFFMFNKEVYVWANGTDRHFLTLGANYRVYDQAIRFAVDHRCQRFIFGASDPNSPQGFFKDRWGAEHFPVFLLSSSSLVPYRWQFQHLLRPLIRLLPEKIYAPFSYLALKSFS